MEEMLERTFSSDSASWDPLNFDDPASVLPNERTTFTDDLEDPGWLRLSKEDDNMFWEDEHPQSVASQLDMSPAETALHSSPDKVQQVDSSFMSCGSSMDMASRSALFSDEQQMPSKAVTEGMLREVLVINGLPFEAKSKAMDAWLMKASRYGSDFYNKCVAQAVSTLATMRCSHPLSTADKVGSSCLDEPSPMNSPRSYSKRSRETDPSPNSWLSASKRQKVPAAYHSNDHEAEGGSFSTLDSLAPKAHRSPFMISNPSVHARMSQKSSFADMDQQLGALMSDESFFGDGVVSQTDSFSAPSYNLSAHNSQKFDGAGWETSTLPFDDVAPGEDLPPCFMQALYTMCNDGCQLVDL